MCPVHRVGAYLEGIPAGQRLWTAKPAEFVSTFRRLLTLLGTPEAARFTPKAFRAGRATALAVAGKSIGHILLAGEWRLAAFLRYVNEDAVDAAQLLDAAMAESSDEE